MSVPPEPWWRILGQVIGIINVLLIIVIIIGLIFTFIAIWRMMKAHEDLASTVKEIGEQLKVNTDLREPEEDD
ncbi:MAG: hypothetical protein U9N81_13595 [Bacillota bacterium]|nr:hypothetical protein [Bacillota bacterium]